VYCSGTLSHNKDFATIKDALLKVAKKYDQVKLVFIGPLDIPEEFQALGDKVEVIPRVPREEVYVNLHKADINLAPLELDNPFCEAKSAIKFTEAGILGLPTVAVRNQTFSEAIEEGVDSFLADSTEEWVEKLSTLVEDEELRKKMGEKARKKVLAEYTNRNSDNQEYYDYIKSKL
jgi:glycosyltransferase involved in cell wall biosynthesis